MEKQIVKIKDVVESFYMAPLSRKEKGGDIYIITPKAIEDGTIDTNKFEEGVNTSRRDITTMYLQSGDVLFQAKGNRYKATCIDKDYDKLIPSQTFFTIKPIKKKVMPEYLTWYLNNKESIKYFDNNSSGTVIKSINRKALEELEITVPPIKEQEKIVELLKSFNEEKTKTEEYIEKKGILVEEKIFEKLRG